MNFDHVLIATVCMYSLTFGSVYNRRKNYIFINVTIDMIRTFHIRIMTICTCMCIADEVNY